MRSFLPFLVLAACRSSQPHAGAVDAEAPGASAAVQTAASAVASPEPPSVAPEPTVDRVAQHTAEWAEILKAHPSAKDVSNQLPPWRTPHHEIAALGYVTGSVANVRGPHYLMLQETTEGPAVFAVASSARKPLPIGSLATFDADKPGARASKVAVQHVDEALWFAGSSSMYLDLGRVPGTSHRAIVEGPNGANFVAVYDGHMDPGTVELTLLALVEGHLAPVLHLTVAPSSLGPGACDDSDTNERHECSWFAPLPQVLKADATGVELLAWSALPQREDRRGHEQLSEQTYVYSPSSRRFEPRGAKTEVVKPFYRVHTPFEPKPSPWTGRYSFEWRGGPGVAGGIGHVRSYDAVITGGEGNLQVTLSEQGTQTVGTTFDAHGDVTPDGLALVLDRCYSDDERTCKNTKRNDVLAVITKDEKLRFRALTSPDGSPRELTGKKLR